MKKRGSHVGIVISFTIFIISIALLIVIFQPAFNVDTKEGLRGFLQNEIIEQTSEEITTISVSITHSSPQSCVELNNFLSGTGLGNKIIVGDDNGNVLSAGISGQDLQVERQGNTFFRIHESEEFGQETGTIGSCQTINEGDNGYSLGLAKTTKRVFETKIISLMSDYNSDYEATKSALGFSAGDGFGFGFKYNNGTLIETTSQDIQANIFADEIPIQYVNKDAATISGSLIVKVW